MRSEVVKIHRYDINHAMPGTPDRRIASNLLSEMCPEIKVGETKSVRISVEILGEKGEEKVGSKAILRVGRDPVITKSDGGDWIDFFNELAQRNDGRTIKSILFATPDGVPVVEFVETPRERLKRQAEYASIKGSAVDAFGLLMAGVQDYLAATAGEGK